MRKAFVLALVIFVRTCSCDISERGKASDWMIPRVDYRGMLLLLLSFFFKTF